MDLSKIKNIVFSGIDHGDHPDYCDAYVGSAEWEDGTPLTDDQLDDLKNKHPDWTYEKLMNYLY